jgi:hypothetical protein
VGSLVQGGKVDEGSPWISVPGSSLEGGDEPPTSSSGEDPRPRWQTAWYLPRSTRTPPSPRSSQRPRGRLVLPIFIPQGWPPAMSHLSGFSTRACFPRIALATWANDVPLGTVANRWVPMACGPNVDQALESWRGWGTVRWVSW